MSFNQSRGDKRSGRPGSHFSGGSGGGGAPTGPSSSSAYYSGKSYKKVVSNNNAQGVQQTRVVAGLSTNSNVNLGSANSAASGIGAPNGSHAQPLIRGTSVAPSTGAIVKPTDAPVQKINPGLPKAPQSAVSHSSATPVKGPADASKGAFPLQFGSISPGVMNGMQVPARTSSAPPNLDEQKRAQAYLGSLKPTSSPNPPIPKQHIPRKYTGPVDQPNTGDTRPISKEKKDVLSTPPPVTAHIHKPSGPPMPSIPMQMPFHHAPVHIPFGTPNPQLQSQGMPNTALPVPLPMHMPVGNPPQVPQQVFVVGIQHHQGLIHQSQGLPFTSQMGPQIGNMGMGMGIEPQYQQPQQPMGNFGSARRTVKITHPDTHEELRLDKRNDGFGGSSGTRPHPHGPPQAHQMNYYPNSYNANLPYFSQPSSNPLTNTQTNAGPQPLRVYNQQASKQVTVKPMISSQGEKVSESLPAVVKREISKSQRAIGESTSTHPRKDLETVNNEAEVANKTTVSKEEQKQPAIKTQSIHVDKIEVQSSSVSSASVAQHGLIDSGLQETPKSTTLPLGTDNVLETSNKVVTANVTDIFASECNSKEESLNSTEIISSETNSDDTSKVEGTKEVVKEYVDQNEDSTILDVTIAQQKENVNNIDDKLSGSISASDLDVLSAKTSSLNLDDDRLNKIDDKDVNQINSKEPVTAVEEPHAGSSTNSECDSKEESLNSTGIISSETNSDDTPKVEGPKEVIKVSVDQNLDSAILDVTVAQQKENVTNIDDKLSGSISASDLDVLSAKTSSHNLDDDRLNKIDDKDVNQINSKEPVTAVEELHAVLVPETTPLSLEAEANSGKMKGNNTAKGGKKKIRDVLKNADARGTTSDLYNAYKRPEEKKETLSSEIVESNTLITSLEKDVMSDDKRGTSKFEPDDWEDAADISVPKMETELEQDDNDGMTKKYSRDFLLKFLDHCTDLPEGFEITPDIAEALISSSVNSPHPSPGRGVGERSARLDRRPSNVGLDEKWNKGSVPPLGGPGWDPRLDLGYLGRGNHGVLRTPRGQPSPQYITGILSGQLLSPGPHGGPMQRNNSESDRWQRATNFQKGLMPSLHTPVMHKAERKYEVGKVTDEEQAKQRQLKGILNKLTPQNFEKLFEQVKQVNIDNPDTLSGVIGQIFDKALMEPTFVEMYANFCSRLAVELPDFSSENNEKITFKRLLLNKCQEEFERGEREEEEANRTEEEGEVKQTDEEREEKRVKARRRMLGNIRLIGELYKKRMLTERIMHECIKKLLGQYDNPDEEDIEALCKLMSTIGDMIDHPKAKEHMDYYFGMMHKLSNNMALSSRVRFMLKDSIDLRKNKWQQRRKVEGPKKIDEVHRDAAQERQAQSSRLTRGPNSNTSLRRGQPMDFGPRGSNVSPSNPQMSAYRGLPQQQVRDFSNQDPRFEERYTFENRPLSIPLRPMGDDLRLGPQGGLARGPLRGQPSLQGMPLHAGPNGYGSIPDRGTGYNMNYVNSDMRSTRHVNDRVRPFSPPEQSRVSTPPQTGPSDKVLSEDRLRDMSIEAIKEFYSARDEKEVALCIKDLNTPSFYPSMISIWVTDSFERKDMDRESLAKLLINLTKSQDGILSQESLVGGFESVLQTLEDAVNDAPKAAEFLGRFFARVLLEDVIPYPEVWRLIYDGGEEQGRLVEIGLAAEVLGVILEIIKSEKGDPFLNNLRANSNLPLEKFRSPSMKKSSRLDKFI